MFDNIYLKKNLFRSNYNFNQIKLKVLKTDSKIFDKQFYLIFYFSEFLYFLLKKNKKIIIFF